MRWRRVRGSGRRRAVPPVVVSVTEPLTRQTVVDLARQVERLDADAPVVIDLTEIPAFDSDGADALLGLQQVGSARRVSIVGLHQATERLVGTVTDTPPAAQDPGWVLRPLRHLVVVQPVDPARTDPASLAAALDQAEQVEAASLVVDLKDVVTLTADALAAIAFASSSAALRERELLVVKVSPTNAEALRGAGMSATTFIAPAPLLDAEPPPGS